MGRSPMSVFVCFSFSLFFSFSIPFLFLSVCCLSDESVWVLPGVRFSSLLVVGRGQSASPGLGGAWLAPVLFSTGRNLGKRKMTF